MEKAIGIFALADFLHTFKKLLTCDTLVGRQIRFIEHLFNPRFKRSNIREGFKV